MDGILGLLLLMALGVPVYFAYRWVGRGVGRVSGAVVGAVTGNTRQRGLAAVHAQTDFVAPVPGPQIIARIQETLELGTKSAQGLKLDGVADDGSALIITQGNPFMEHLKFIVDTNPAGQGCTGFATTANWVESDGQITTTENIERIHKHVRSAVQHFGGKFSESTNT